ncbi:hypothetical protein GCM10007052_37040 [Halioglobus japonicus]|nr:hypothetical protein GCM10007052_37040 [Halioglobus japonicus]
MCVNSKTAFAGVFRRINSNDMKSPPQLIACPRAKAAIKYAVSWLVKAVAIIGRTVRSRNGSMRM